LPLKKLVFIFLFCLSGGLLAQTTLVDEPLRDGSLPTGWTATSVSFPTVAGGYAHFTASNSVLTSPIFDFSGYSDIELNYAVAKFGSGSDGPLTIQTSIDGGTTWTAQSFNTSTPTSSTYIADGPITLSPTSNQFRIRFLRTVSPSEKRLRDVLIVGTLSCTPPTITNFSPTSGLVGSFVTITGSGFQVGSGTSSVLFNGEPSTNFTVNSNTEIEAEVPAAATTGLIEITTNGCSITSGSNFTVLACLPPNISSFSPTSGPVGTKIYISGTGFEAGTGTTLVEIGSQSITYNVISDILIEAIIPSSLNNGALSITTNNCVGSAGVFTFVEPSVNCSTITTDLIISELYDADSGSLAYLEIYNGTGSAVNLIDYQVKIFNNGNSTASTFCGALPNVSLANNQVYVASFGGTSIGSLASVHLGNCGINENDCVHLQKNNISIDIWGECDGSNWTPSASTGYTFIRNASVDSPNTTYTPSEWTIKDPEDLTDIGSHSFNSGPSLNITTEPSGFTICEGQSSSISFAYSSTGFTINWQSTNNTSDFNSLVNSSLYSGVSTTNLAFTNVPFSINNFQYYATLTNGTCVLNTKSVEITVLPLPTTSVIFHN